MVKYLLLKHYRGRWDTDSIAEGVTILQAALARDHLTRQAARLNARRSR